MAYCKFQTPCGFCTLKSVPELYAIKCEKYIEPESPIYKSRKYSDYYEEKPDTNKDETS